LIATLSSLKKLLHNNQLYNYRIFEEYVNKALEDVNYPTVGMGSQQGADKLKIIKNKFIGKLLNNIAFVYELHLDKEKVKDFRLKIYQKIQSVKSRDELVVVSGDFYDVIKDYSQQLFDLKNTSFEDAKKIEPLFKFAFKVRVGMHNGDVVWGSVGSKTANIEISMVGDPVNSTSRLETANKTYGTNILVSEEFLKNLFGGKELKLTGSFKYKKHQVSYREIDHVKVVGKDKPVKIYELIHH
jgi:hypothetical protein